MTVVDRIVSLMDSRGVSGTALTSAVEISSSSITEWKKGKAKPSVDAVVKIAEYFDVTTDWLLMGKVAVEEDDDPPTHFCPFINNVCREDCVFFDYKVGQCILPITVGGSPGDSESMRRISESLKAIEECVKTIESSHIQRRACEEV